VNSHEHQGVDVDIRKLILAWYLRARLAQLAHAAAAGYLRNLRIGLGLPATVFTVIAGAVILIDASGAWRILAGSVSLLAAVLIALQTFLNFDEQIRVHEGASREYGSVRRLLGELGAISGQERDEVRSSVHRIRELYDSVSAGTPNVPDWIWEKTKRDSNGYWPEEFGSWPEAPHSRAAKAVNVQSS
jgi:hypothetical protein